MQTTIDTVTDAQLRKLEAEAGEAGDLVQAALCRIARGEAWDDIGLNATEKRFLALDGLRPESARAMCLSVIRDAQACRSGE